MYYHGTNSKDDFSKLEPNGFGLIWVTQDRQAAIKYASKYYNEGIMRVFNVNIKGDVLDFTNKNNNLVKEIIQRIKSKYFFDIEAHWDTSAGFGIIEANLWIIDELIEKGYSGIYLLDHTGSYDHSSIAIINDNFVIEEIEYI